MILEKLEEALAEIPAQRLALDEVEADLRSMIAKLKGMPNVAEGTPAMTASATSFIPVSAMDLNGQKDRIEEVADILRNHGQALHITTIAQILSKLHGTKILRTDIEPGMNRHIAKTKKRKLAKFGPSIYGLPEWNDRAQPSLAKSA